MFKESSKAMRIGAWVLIVPIALIVIRAAVSKFLPDAPLAQVPSMAAWVTYIGLAELVAAVLFIIPRTSIIGAFFLSAYLGGAILFHMNLGQPMFGPPFASFWFQSTLLALVWVVTVLRYPAIIDNFKAPMAANQERQEVRREMEKA